MSVNDWTYIGYRLATWGIPSDVNEITTDDYEPDPWRPDPNTDAITITLTLRDAGRLMDVIPDPSPAIAADRLDR